MEKAVSNFLSSLGVPISEQYIQRLVASHPHFPSLLSVSDTLHRLGISHSAKRIGKNNLNDLPYPYLLPFDKGMGSILLIRNKYDLEKYRKELEWWDGVVLQADPIKEVKDRLNNDLYLNETRIKRFTVGLFLTVFATLLLPILISFSMSAFVLFVTATIGACTGFFLLAKELGISYASLELFCNTGKKTNCDKVLDADIKFLGIHLPEWVIIYFCFQLVMMSMAHLLGVKYFLDIALTVFSVFTLPFIFFSVYYQYAMIKTWCRLCLVVSGILTIQFVVILSSYFNPLVWSIDFPVPFVLGMFLLLTSIVFMVFLVKASVKRAMALTNIGADGNRVKHSISVFDFLLKQQRSVDQQPLEKEMLMGNPTAPIKIIMVSNLFCNPCKQKHKVIEDLLTIYPDKVSVVLRFVKSRDDKESVGYLLNYWQHTIHGQGNESLMTASLLHDWYEIWDLEKFKKKYPLSCDGNRVIDLEKSHYAWIERADVQFTPTFFVNGFKLPKEYSIDDMMVLVPELGGSL